jgi:hypothetical protein
MQLEAKLMVCREAQYRARFDSWGPKWKKHEKSVDREPVEIALARYKSIEVEVDMYEWGKLVPEERVTQIRDRGRVPQHKLRNENCIVEPNL